MSRARVSAEVNVIGALAIALSDRLRAATEEAARMPAGFPAALTCLRTWAGGRSVDVLAGALGLSHSRAVRVVDQLESDGLARRRRGTDDARVVHLELTPAGGRAADRILAARARVLDDALSELTPAQITALTGLSSSVLGTLVGTREAARHTCRLCDAIACGHERGTCPVTQAVDRALASG